MEFVEASGGREKYYHKTNVRDCVTRAICNATGNDYKETYDKIRQELVSYNKRHRRSSTKHDSPRNGIPQNVTDNYIEKILGWKYHKMELDTRLGEYKFPKGTYIIRISGHLTCIKDNVLYDS